MLTTTQRVAVRAVADGERINKRDTASLICEGLIHVANGKPFLTAEGRAAHERIMSSGDGPEALKAMFRI